MTDQQAIQAAQQILRHLVRSTSMTDAEASDSEAFVIAQIILRNAATVQENRIAMPEVTR